MKTASLTSLHPFRALAQAAAAVMLAVGLSVSLPVQAGVINHADVNGFRTFQDTNTGRVWLDLDSFVDANHHLLPGYESVGQMRAAALAAGFVMAYESDVAFMVSETGIPSANWAHLEATMASLHGAGTVGPSYYFTTVEALAGFALNPVGDAISRYESRADSMGWYTGNFPGFPTDVFFDSGSYLHIGLWAYLDSNAGPGPTVPEPGSLLLVGLGLMTATAAAVRRRRRR